MILPVRFQPNLNGIRSEARKDQSRFWPAAQTKRFMSIETEFRSVELRFRLDNPVQPLGGHAFTMLEGVTETPSAFVPGRPAHRWLAVRTAGNATLEDIGRRVHVSPAFAEKVYDIVYPGTTIVVTDAPALSPSPSTHAVLLMEAAKQ